MATTRGDTRLTAAPFNSGHLNGYVSFVFGWKYWSARLVLTGATSVVGAAIVNSTVYRYNPLVGSLLAALVWLGPVGAAALTPGKLGRPGRGYVGAAVGTLIVTVLFGRAVALSQLRWQTTPLAVVGLCVGLGVGLAVMAKTGVRHTAPKLASTGSYAPRRGSVATPARAVVSTVKFVVGAVGIAFLIGGWAYGHSTTFKIGCLAQKVGVAEMPFPKNIICDAMFDLKPN
jgi:hypothetical protein